MLALLLGTATPILSAINAEPSNVCQIRPFPKAPPNDRESAQAIVSIIPRYWCMEHAPIAGRIT